jgi:hypothetical protein
VRYAGSVARFIVVYGVLVWGTISGTLFLAARYLLRGTWPSPLMAAVNLLLWWAGGACWGWRMWRWRQRHRAGAIARS